MVDLISRQAAIDALDVLCQEHRYKIPGELETYSQYNEAWQDALDRAEGAIGNLPSAQPEPCEDALGVNLHVVKISKHCSDFSDLDKVKECEDAVSREAAIDIFDDYNVSVENGDFEAYSRDRKRLCELPSAQPEPISDAYMNAVWTWLLDYQIKAAELKGRYTPYEVLSWVVNDWRKEHE